MHVIALVHRVILFVQFYLAQLNIDKVEHLQVKLGKLKFQLKLLQLTLKICKK